MSLKRILWDDVREKLRKNEEKLERALIPTPERIEDVYRKRAERLSKKEALRHSSALLRVMVFRIGTQRYAIEMKNLAEVVSSAQPAPIPGAPREFVGAIQVRGEIRSVVSLPVLLDIDASSPITCGPVLLLRSARQEIGVLAQAIEEFKEIRADELLPAQAPQLKGITAGGLMIVDVDAVLAAIHQHAEPAK